MPVPTLPDLAVFDSHPTPEPAPDADADRVEPIVTTLSEDILYLHGPHLPQKRQFLAAAVDNRPLLRIDPRERYAEVVVDITHTYYSLTADAVQRVYSTAKPYFEAAESTPSELTFSFRSAETDHISMETPRGKITIDGLEIDAAKTLLGELAETVGKYSDFVYLGDDDFDSHFGPPRHLPREGAPPVHQPEGVDEPFQLAPIENKAVTTEQIEDHYSEATLKEANELIRFDRNGGKQYWADAGHRGMAEDGVSGYCKIHVQPTEPACEVYISNGDIVDENCVSSDHDAPCKHTAAALLLAPSVSEHYL